MKRAYRNWLRNTLAAASIALAAGACEERVDEVAPRTQITPEQVTAADAEALIRGVYDAAQGADGAGRVTLSYLVYVTRDLAADVYEWHQFFNPQWPDNDRFQIPAVDVLNERHWLHLYYTIHAANDVINLLQDSPIPEVQSIVGEARLIRAWKYFELSQFYGDVAVVLDRSGVQNPRTPRAQVWSDLIVPDLQLAHTLLPTRSAANRNRASKEAATALLARVRLYQENWSEALRLSDSLITASGSGIPELSSDYASIFNNPEGSNEVIFRITNTEQDGQFIGFFLQEPGLGRGDLVVDRTLVNSFAANDPRADLIYASSNVEYAPGDPKYYTSKWPDVGTGADDWIVVRMAEMYLISAEANAQLLNLAAGTDRLNELRDARGLPDVSPADVGALLLDIENERWWELYGEGHRWNDLWRTGRAADVLGDRANIEFYPIPQRFRDTNPALDQNEGY